jgi:hypothetical protein
MAHGEAASTPVEDENAPVSQSASKPRRRIPAIAVVAAIVVLLLGAGTAAAFTVPVISINADRPLAQMLPAGTVFFVSADLNPAGQTKTNLDRAVHAFTDQPGWRDVVKAFQSGTHSTPSTGSCYDKASNQALQHLTWLGHETAIALVSTSGLNATGSTASDALQRDALLLAPLHVQQTLAQALSGFHLTLPPSGTSYGGTTIYREPFISCGQVSGGTAADVYAALEKGYVLLALKPDAIERVIDTANGKNQKLSTSATYNKLTNKLPANRLATYYVDGSAFAKTKFARSLQVMSSSSVPLSAGAQPAAGALTVESGGFRFTTVAKNTGSKTVSAPAGTLAAQLPNDVLGYFSVRDLAKQVKSSVSTYEKSGLLSGSSKDYADVLVTEVTDFMTSEVDFVFYRPDKTLNLSSGSSDFYVPAAAMWQVSNQNQARVGLDTFVLTELTSTDFTSGMSGGTSYEAATSGYGYAVRKGWAIASLSIADMLSRLNTGTQSPLSSSQTFQTAFGVPGGPLATTASAASSVFYLNLADTRAEVEKALLPSLPSATRQQYQQDVQPILAPLTVLSGSTSSANSGEFDISTAFLGVK